MFSNKIFTKIEISAPAETVWRILTDFKRYPEWNPFIIRIEGDLRVKARLMVRLKPPGGKVMNFAPRIKKLSHNAEISWLGYFFLPGLFDGEHVFVVEKLSTSKTLFMQSETFRGLVVLIILPFIRRRTMKGFRNMNEALRDRAESLK